MHCRTQRTVHARGVIDFSVITARVQQFHAATGRTNQLHIPRTDDAGCDSRAQKQHKPHQREAGEEFGVPQEMHE